ncbi:MAG: YihY/virulence factor BrkB family protein [Spirochaetaceae bacterium]|jgi:membrane protein|nr:YihY/virulence factor BrkB family protein [Spirochaetaceae bacterium]
MKKIRLWNIKRLCIRFHRKSIIGMVIEKSVQDRIPHRAAGLAFTTLLALVPIMAVVLSFGGYDSIQSSVKNYIVDTLLPGSQETLLQSLNEFAQNSRRLGTWGLLISLIIIVLLLNSIENTFNQVLRTRPSKTFLTRVSAYTAALIFGTLLAGTSLTFSGKFPGFANGLIGDPQGGMALPLIHSLYTIIVISISLMLLIYLFPAGQMKFKSVFLASITGGLLWEGSRNVFSIWAGTSVRNSVIYGSLFLIPLLFIWVQVAWIIILVSLEITYVHQHGNIPRSSITRIELPQERVALSMDLFLYICQLYRNRRKPPRLYDLCQRVNLNEEMLLSLLSPFENKNLLHRIDGKSMSYVPGADLRKIGLDEVMKICLSGRGVAPEIQQLEGNQLWDFYHRGAMDELKHISVEDWLNRNNSEIFSNG